jgi:hypothetical protein
VSYTYCVFFFLIYRMKAATTDGVHAFLNDLSGVTSKSTIKVRITRLWDTWNVDKKKRA